ncbi:hypothetical protein GLX27_001286 [Malassezia furfur]|uniref:DNA-directed RNA polymerase III subunit RPC9 n=1 Tax=Malassezia furfur TaxID=55194 RepID=A0ABY8EMC0_MALFU|nr:hypothetical protein GLX27_001286 [Malassezia furfur]
MRIVKTRAALLSDYEVLQLLRDTETRQREAARPDNEDAEAWMKAVPPNVRTIQFETIASLSQAHRPCARQEAHHIHGFLKAVEEKGYAPSDAKILQGTPGLTKAERLQLVNHAPMSVVELHTVRVFTDTACGRAWATHVRRTDRRHLAMCHDASSCTASAGRAARGRGAAGARRGAGHVRRGRDGRGRGRISRRTL